MINFENNLNKEQYQVVTQGDGPCLVLAGAGSGKTRTLVYRVAYLIHNKINPDNILLVTFTNKAAKEMLSRVEKLLGFNPDDLWGGTFHRLGNLFLRKYGDKLGYERNFGILDQDDSVSLVKQCLTDLNLNVQAQNFPKPKVVQAVISYAVNTNQDIKELAELKYNFPDFIAEKLELVEDLYHEKKQKMNVMDFDDLLKNWLLLLINFPELKEKLSKQFQYILVDEYQDTNYLQSEIVKELASFHNNILVVGDDSQSIYSFRAADVNNILNFPKQFANSQIFKIESNYRSTPQIVTFANKSIQNNQKQFRKKLYPSREDGMLPMLVSARDVKQQAVFVIQRVMALKNQRVNLRDIAILFRATYQSADLQLQLAKNNIPFVVRGGARYFEQAHIKDMTAFLKILNNVKDELSWQRVLQMFEGVGKVSANKIWNNVKDCLSLTEVLDINISLSGKAGLAWEKIKMIFNQLLKLKESQDCFISEAVSYILKSNYEEYLRNNFDNYKDRLEDLQQFMDFVANYDDLEKLLSDVLLSENFAKENSKDEESDYVLLSTIHQSKGLEWPYVLLIGCSDGEFPHYKSLERPNELEEERRLFYVAVTRAKDELFLFYPQKKFSYEYGEVNTKVSMFIREVDPSCYIQKFSTEEPERLTEDDVIYYD